MIASKSSSGVSLFLQVYDVFRSGLIPIDSNGVTDFICASSLTHLLTRSMKAWCVRKWIGEFEEHVYPEVEYVVVCGVLVDLDDAEV